MRISLQPGYLLHRRPFRDSSQLLEVLTLDFGRIGVVARGTRRKSRGGSQGSLLQPFAPLLLTYAGAAELKNLSAVEAAGEHLQLHGDALLSGFYLNELLVRLLHRDDPQPVLFGAYSVALRNMARGEPIEHTLREFEFALLEELGYRFALDTEAGGGARVEAEAHYRFQAGSGLQRIAEAESSGNGSYRGEDLLAAARGDYAGEAGRAAKQLSRSALAELLGGKPLRSRQLFLRAGSERTKKR